MTKPRIIETDHGIEGECTVRTYDTMLAGARIKANPLGITITGRKGA